MRYISNEEKFKHAKNKLDELRSEYLLKYEEEPENLKTDINELLWICLPCKCTLQRAEEIACNIYEIIMMEYNNE